MTKKITTDDKNKISGNSEKKTPYLADVDPEEESSRLNTLFLSEFSHARRQVRYPLLLFIAIVIGFGILLGKGIIIYRELDKVRNIPPEEAVRINAYKEYQKNKAAFDKMEEYGFYFPKALFDKPEQPTEKKIEKK